MLLPLEYSLVILNLRCQKFNISRHSWGFSKATFVGFSQVPRDASVAAVLVFVAFLVAKLLIC